MHGLSTPGVLLGPNGLVPLAGGTALPVGGVVPRSPRSPRSAAARTSARVGWGPPSCSPRSGCRRHRAARTGPLPALPQAGTPRRLLVFGRLLFALIAQRAVRTYALTRRARSLGGRRRGLAGVALYPALMLTVGTWAWWMGHMLAFAGVGLVGLPLALDVRRGFPSHRFRRPVRRPLVAEAETFLGNEVRALLDEPGGKDARPRSTPGGSPTAVAIGEAWAWRGAAPRPRAGRDPARHRQALRPAVVLAKPGALTDEEMD